MSSNEAKLHLSLKDGVFEISGSELFVSQQIENFKDVILASLQKGSNITGETNEEISYSDNAIGSQSEEQTKTINIDYPKVLHIEDTDIKIIKKMPGSNKAQKSVNTALVYLAAKKSVGVDGVSSQDIRELCRDQGCLDTGNFASHMKNAKEYIIIEGKKGSSTQMFKLTLPGTEKALELLKDLNGKTS